MRGGRRLQFLVKDLLSWDGAPGGGSGRRLKVAVAAAWTYPFMLVGSLYATWCSAWIILGHRPRPSLDDPKFISLWVDLPYAAHMGLMIAFPAALGGGLVATWLAARTHSFGARPMMPLVAPALLALLWVCALGLLRADPWQAYYWFAD